MARRITVRSISLALAMVLAATVSSAPAVVADDTAPVIRRTVSPRIGPTGWFTGPVNIRWEVRDPESPWTTTGCDARTLRDDTAGVSVSCRAESAGGSATNAMVVRIDATPPRVTGASPDRGPDANGWYNHALRVQFSGQDALSGVASCRAAEYAGPDAEGASVTGTCVDVAGNTSAPTPFAFRYDATPPAILGHRMSRPPDLPGWYRAPVGIGFDASDALSGAARCDDQLYSGPDSAAATVVATCTDAAGNVATAPFQLPYDATAPDVSVWAEPGHRMAVVRWSASADAVRYVVRRQELGRPRTKRTVYRGAGHRLVDHGLRNGRRYRYSVTAIDGAAHHGTRAARVRPGRRLLSPRGGARVTRPPVLRWTHIPGARYYNVQLFKGRTRVLSAWSRNPFLALPEAWTFRGRARRLDPGRYEWWVWPGRGRSEARYGRLIGRRTLFVVAG